MSKNNIYNKIMFSRPKIGSLDWYENKIGKAI